MIYEIRRLYAKGCGLSSQRSSVPGQAAPPALRGDPVLFSVLLHRLNGIVREMTEALEQAAMTRISALCSDYSCCIYDTQARQIATA